jgi:succinyl-CoA synthetase beta subunit
VNLHEYQAKEVFASYGVPVPDGQVARTPEEAAAATQALGGELWVVKAQVHAGGRGKVGGVKLVRSASEAAEAAKGMLGGRLVTKQTGEEGLPINLVYVETGSKIERELYLSLLVDRGSERVAIIASSEGGMDIEEVAENTPEKILQININPAAGLFPWQARKLGFALGLSAEQVKKFTGVLDGLYRMFVERDLSLVEINPLIVTAEGDIKALDGKVNVDGSALYRQQALVDYRDTSQEDETELKASEHDLNYVSLDGNIACMVNGAGLAMATMDLIKLHGGNPANFLDVGGGATAERVTAAFKLILANQKVKAILVNIFGGIVRCDLIAEGIIIAVKEVGVSLPVIVRLEGTNVELGRKLLADSGLAITAAADLTDAAKKAVSAAAAA